MDQRLVALYAWGKNDKGELSQNSQTNILLPTAVKKLANRCIISVSSGSSHSSAVDSEGRIYTCGGSLHGKLGLDNSSTVPVFTQVRDLSYTSIVQVSCGDYHTLCLGSDGSVYTWGGSLYQKLGQKSSPQKSSKIGEVSILRDKGIKFVDCGDFHSVALSFEGELYSWGGGGTYNKGQCGHGHCRDVEMPSSLRFFECRYVSKVACGGYHTIVLVAGSEVYAWGDGERGQCGTGEFTNTSSPKPVLFPWVKKAEEGKEIIELAAGGYHSLALTSDGGVFSWGYNAVGQLGLRQKKNQAEPLLVNSLSSKSVRMVAAGWNHSIVLTNKADVFTCGFGKFGQLGLGNTASVTIFTHVIEISGKNIRAVSAGGHHSWAIVDTEQPLIDDYGIPSPLHIELENEDTPYATSKQFFGEAPFSIGVVYSDVEYCHRFAKFKLAASALELVKEYVSEVYITETGIRHDIIQEDEDASYNLLIICDPSLNQPPVLPSGLTCEPSQDVNEITMADIRANPAQEALAEWARYFLLKLDRLLVGTPVFFELRPVTYYMPK